MAVRILIGDARAKLAELADDSVHCVELNPAYVKIGSDRIVSDGPLFANVEIEKTDAA